MRITQKQGFSARSVCNTSRPDMSGRRRSVIARRNFPLPRALKPFAPGRRQRHTEAFVFKDHLERVGHASLVVDDEYFRCFPSRV